MRRTTGDGANDEQTLEREADAMGARAARAPAPAAVRQFKFDQIASDPVPTPAESVKVATGVPVANQLLPAPKVQPAKSVARPRKISALIDQSTLRTDERADDGILSKVTSMARAEQRILQGSDMLKFYDAGHLVGDQLIGGDGTDSFEYWNLAPQISSFNTPNYAGIEDKVKALAQTYPVRMEVELEYPPDYTVTVGHLLQRGIVTQSKSDENTNVKFYRRIPNKWRMQAEVVGVQGVRSTLAYPRAGSPKTPRLGSPFFMESGAVGVQSQLFGYVVSGEQWAPSTTVEGEEIISLLASKFPDLGGPEQIIERIMPDGRELNRSSAVRLIKEAAANVAQALMALSKRLSELKDPTVMQEYLALSEKAIKEHLAIASSESTPLGEAVQHLATAQSWVEALTEQASEVGREQLEQFFFTLTQQQIFRQNLPETKYAREFEFSFNQYTPQFSETNPEQYEQVEKARSELYDLRGKVQPISSASGGGEIIMSSFGPPKLLYNQSVLLSDNLIARVEAVTKEVSLDDLPTGRWIIRYRYS